MITKIQARELLKQHLRGQIAWAPEEYGDSWDSAEEIERMRLFLSQESEKYAERRVSEWGDSAEVPCGWLFHSWKQRFGGPTWFLVNRWTGQVADDTEVCEEPEARWLPGEAKLRLYIEALPDEQRREAEGRMALLPYEPVRFYPPLLIFDGWHGDESEPQRFVAEFDPAFFAGKELPVPRVVLTELDTNSEEFFVELPGAIRKLREWDDSGRIYEELQIVVPLKKRNNIKVGLKFSHIPPGLADMAYQLSGEYHPPLCFHDRC